MVDADTTTAVAKLGDYRLHEEDEEDDNRSCQLSQTSDLWETSGVRMSALCLNVLHDINDAASQYSTSSDRGGAASAAAAKKESRKKGFADFFRFSKRRSKSKKKKSDASGLDADSSKVVSDEDWATRKIPQHGDSASIPSGKEGFGYKEGKKLGRSMDATDDNFDISANKSATLPPKTKEDKQNSDLKKKTKLGSITTKSSKRPMQRADTLPPPRSDHAAEETKSHRFTGPLRLLEANIQKMVTSVNRKFPSSEGGKGRVKDGIGATRDLDDRTSRDQSFVSKKEESKASISNLNPVVSNDHPRPAARKSTAKSEQGKMDEELGSGKESPRRSPAASPRGRTRGKGHDKDRPRRGRSAEVASKKGKRIRRRALSREWILVKTTTIEDTTFFGPMLKKAKRHHPSSESPYLAAAVQANSEIEAGPRSVGKKTRRDPEGPSSRKRLTKGMSGSQNSVQNDLNNNDSIDDSLPINDPQNSTARTVDLSQKSGPKFSLATSDPSPYPAATKSETTEGSFTNLSIPTELEMKLQSEETNMNPLSPNQALIGKESSEKDEANTLHIKPQFSSNPASPVTLNHTVFPDSHVPAVGVVQELDMKTLCPATDNDQLSSILEPAGKERPEQDELTAFQIASQFIPHPTPTIIQKHPIATESHFPALNIARDINMTRLPMETDIDQLSPVHALVRKERPGDAGIEGHVGIEPERSSNFWDDEDRLSAATDKSRWTKRKPVSRTEPSAFDSRNLADDPVYKTANNTQDRFPKIFSGIPMTTEGEPFDCKMMRRNEAQTSRPTKPRWTKRKPVTRGRRQSPSRDNSDVHSTPTFEVTTDKSKPFFFGDASAIGDLSSFEVKATHGDQRQISGQSKPRWSKRKPATRGKRSSQQSEGDKATTCLPMIGGIRNEPFIYTADGFVDNYDFFDVGHHRSHHHHRRVPGFAEETFVGHEPLFHEVSPMFGDPVFMNVHGTDEQPLLARLSRNQIESSHPLEDIHLNNELTCSGRDDSTTTTAAADGGRGRFVDDTHRNSLTEPEFFWNTNLSDEPFSSLASTGDDIQAVDMPRTVASQSTKNPTFFWNSPVNDESTSEFEDKNDVSFYGDAEVSDEQLSASEAIPDKNDEPSFFWNTAVDNDHAYNNNEHLVSSDCRNELPSSLQDQTEAIDVQPFSDDITTNITNESSLIVQCTDDATDGPSVPDNSNTRLHPTAAAAAAAAEHNASEVSATDNTQVMHGNLNALLLNCPTYAEKCEGDQLKSSSDQPAKHATRSGSSVEKDCAANNNRILNLDSGSTPSSTSQDQPICTDPHNPDSAGHSSLPGETMGRLEDKSAPSVDYSNRLDDKDDHQGASSLKGTIMPLNESDGSHVPENRSHLSESVQDREVLAGGECPGSVHDMPPSDELLASFLLPQEDNSNQTKLKTQDSSSASKQNDDGDYLKAEPENADSRASPLGSHPGVNYRSRSRQSVDGERATKGRGSLVDDGRTVSPLFKYDSGSGNTPSPRNSASDAQLRDWSSRRFFSPDDDRSSPMMYFPRRLNVDLPYSDSGYSETEAETMSPCSFRSSISRADTMTGGEEGRYDSIADDDGRFTFQITDDMRSSWYNMGGMLSERESIDCFSPDSGLQVGEKVEAPWSLATTYSNSLGLVEEPVFAAYQMNEKKSTESDSRNTFPEKLAGAVSDAKMNSPDRQVSGSEPTTAASVRTDEFAPTSQRQGNTEFRSDSDAKMNSPDRQVSGSEPTTAASVRTDEFAPTSQRQGNAEFRSDGDAKMNSSDIQLSGSDLTTKASVRDDEFAPTSQRQGNAEIRSDSDAKMNSPDRQVSGSEPTTAASVRTDEFAPTSQRQGNAEFRSDSDAKMNSSDRQLSGYEPTTSASINNNEFSPTSQRQGNAEVRSDSDAKMNSSDRQVSGSEPTTSASIRNDEFAPTSQRQGNAEFRSDSDAKMNSSERQLSGSEPTTAASINNNEFSPTSQRQGNAEFRSDSDAKMNSPDRQVSGSESTTSASTRNDEIAPTYQRQGNAEFRSDSDAKMNSPDRQVSGSESTTSASTRNDKFASTSQRQGNAEFRSDSDAKMNSPDRQVSGSESTTATSTRNDEFAPTSQRQGNAEFRSDSDAKMNSSERQVSGSEPTTKASVRNDEFAPTSQRQGKGTLKSEKPQLQEGSCKAQDRSALEMTTLSEHDEETVDLSVESSFRKQEPLCGFVIPTNVGRVESEETGINKDEALTKETRHHNQSCYAEEDEAVVQKKALPSKVMLVSKQGYQVASEASNRFKTQIDDALVSFEQDDGLSAKVGLYVTEDTATESLKSSAKIEITREFTAEGARKFQNDDTFTYTSVTKQNHEPVICYIIPENERTDEASNDKSVKRVDRVCSELPISVVKEDLGTDNELFTWYEYAELHSIFRQFPEENELTHAAAAGETVDLSLLPSTWIWNGSRFINYASTANKESTIHFPDPRLCRSISCPMQQDAFTLVGGAPLRRQSLLSALERLQLSCSAEKEALIQIRALRSRIQGSHSPAKEDLVKVRALLKEIQKSSPLWEEAHIQAKDLLRRIQISLCHEKEECNAVSSEIQQSRSAEEQDLVGCNTLTSEFNVRNSSDEEDLHKEMLKNDIQQFRSLEQQTFIECNALLSELHVINSSEVEDLVQDEIPESETQHSRPQEQQHFMECIALLSELQVPEAEDLVQDEIPESENHHSRPQEQQHFMECIALLSELQIGNSSEVEGLVQDEIPESENHHSRPQEQQHFMECIALLSELQVGNSSEVEGLVQDEIPESQIHQSKPQEQQHFMECIALLSELQVGNSSEVEDLVQDEIPESENHHSRPQEQQHFMECIALLSELQVGNSSEVEDFVHDEIPESEIQQSKSQEQQHFMECIALKSELHVPEVKDLVHNEIPESEIQQSRPQEQQHFMECIALQSELQVGNSSEVEDVAHDEIPESEIQQSKSQEQQHFMECIALQNELHVPEVKDLVQDEIPESEIQQSRPQEQQHFMECIALQSELQVPEVEGLVQDEILDSEIEQSRLQEQQHFIDCIALQSELQVGNSSKVEDVVHDEIPESETQAINSLEEKVSMDDKARSRDGSIKNDAAREPSISLDKQSAEQEFSGAEQGSDHNDDAPAESLIKPSTSETLSTSHEPDSQRSPTEETDISSGSHLRLRSRSTPDDDDDDDDVDAASSDDVSPKQTKTVRSKRPVVICLLTATAGLLSALLILFLGVHMKYIDI